MVKKDLHSLIQVIWKYHRLKYSNVSKSTKYLFNILETTPPEVVLTFFSWKVDVDSDGDFDILVDVDGEYEYEEEVKYKNLQFWGENKCHRWSN